MPRLYLKLLFPIVVSGLMMMIVARTLGSTQEANPSLRGFTESCEGKSQPCWNGIVPGKTTAESTFRYLAQLGYAIDDAIFSNTRQLTAHFPDRPDCGQITANIDQRIGILYEFYVHPCDMPLGAFLDSFGTPVIANLEYEDCSVLLLFMEGHIQVTAANSVQPTHAIIGFGLLSDETVQLNQSRDSERFQWAGILPMWRYKSQFAPPFRMPMIRRYFKLIPWIALIFLALTLVARTLGTTQPPNPALRGFNEGCGDKPRACWFGIVPDVTTKAQADSILGSLGYRLNESIELYGGKYMNSYRSSTLGCYLVVLYSVKDDSPIEGPVVSCKKVPFGDAAALFGTPTDMIYINRNPTLRFGEHIEGRMYGTEAWTSFYNPILAFALSTPILSSDEDNPPVHWRGAVSRKRYCQIDYTWQYCRDFPQ